MLSNILDNCGYLDANVFALYLRSRSANNMIGSQVCKS